MKTQSSFRAIALFAVSLASLGVACKGARGELEGSGTAKTEPRSVSGFTQIALSGGGDVTITQSGNESLTVQADDNVVPHLTSIVSGGKLTLGADSDNIHPKTPIRFTVTVKDLSAIVLEGAGDITATGIHASTLDVTVSGAGDVKLTGSADRESIAITGAGDFDGSGLESKNVTATVTGTGDASVRASDTLDVTINGAGSVTYAGDPKVTKKISGVGSVAKR